MLSEALPFESEENGLQVQPRFEYDPARTSLVTSFCPTTLLKTLRFLASSKRPLSPCRYELTAVCMEIRVAGLLNILDTFTGSVNGDVTGTVNGDIAMGLQTYQEYLNAIISPIIELVYKFGGDGKC
jgi:hypothetical protein